LEDTQAVAALVERCLGGEAAAWEEIIRLYHRRIYNLCYRFAGSAENAQDLTQEVFIKMYRTLKSYDGSKGAFITWVMTIARNLLVDHFRRSKHDRVTDSFESAPAADPDAPSIGEQLPDRGPTPDARIQSQEAQRAVQQALQKLSPDLREAVILRDLEDLEYREIAQVLRVPEGTVKSRINRGRAELARHLSRTYRQAS
jgi:RNA polymerase sigma-70 factor, ECF subfamily